MRKHKQPTAQTGDNVVVNRQTNAYRLTLPPAGKREQHWCVADPVDLHIHERISTQAILRVAKRQDEWRW